MTRWTWLACLVVLVTAVAARADAPRPRALVVSEKLAMRLELLDMEGKTVKELVTEIEKKARLNVIVGWHDRGLIALNSDRKLVGKLEGVTVRFALESVIAAGFTLPQYSPPVLEFSDTDGDAVRVANGPETETRVYNLSNLVGKMRKEFLLRVGEPIPLDLLLDQIGRNVTTHIDTRGWLVGDGSRSINFIGLRMVVRQTAENHAAIADLLAKLEAGDGK